MTLDEVARLTTDTRNRFAGAVLDYFDNDCGKMVIFHLKLFPRWLPVIGPAGQWRSARGLYKFLKRNGGSGAAVIDGWGVPRIDRARAMMGDIVEMPGEPPMGAFGVVMGNGAVLAWTEHEAAQDTAAILRPSEILTAWRPW